MSDEKRDVLERLAGWGFTSLKETVQAGQSAMKKGAWSLHIAAARSDDANKISLAYSNLFANAAMLFEVVDDLADEVREQRDTPCAGLTEAQARIKSLEDQLAKLIESRDYWKREARVLDDRIGAIREVLDNTVYARGEEP